MMKEVHDQTKEREVRRLKRMLEKENGITLVALVVTIVVLIILATVSISAVMGDDGIIKKAQLAKNMHANSVEAEQDAMDTLFQEYANAMAGEGSVGDTTNETEEETPTEPEENIDPETGWNLDKVTKVTSEDNIVVPVPIGYTR